MNMNPDRLPSWWYPTGRGYSTKDGWQIYVDEPGGHWRVSHWGSDAKTKSGRRRHWVHFHVAYKYVEKQREALKPV